MTYGDPNWQPWIMPLEQALPILKHAYDRGINTFDVADTYSNGRSEEILGAFLKKYNIKRSSVVIMSKIFYRVDDRRGSVDPVGQQTNDGKFVNQVGLSRKHILDGVDASIERLGTYIDVLQIHRLDRDTPMEEIMKGLNAVVESGKARYIGASSVSTLSLGDALVHNDQWIPDGCLGVPDDAKYRREAWLAEVHLHARLLQPSLS